MAGDERRELHAAAAAEARVISTITEEAEGCWAFVARIETAKRS
jgi:hypothetical protein